jgi:hypothetical protein
MSMGVIEINVQYLSKSHNELFLVYKNTSVCLLSMGCLKKLWLIPQGFPYKQLGASNHSQDLSKAVCSNQIDDKC